MATKKVSKPKNEKKHSKVGELFRSEMTKFVVGLLVLLVAAFLSLAFFSFFVTGKADQSIIENLSALEIFGTHTQITNWAGA
ncbi:MAG: hypothetical protein HUJ97_08770, partial [Bacteroidales bacterium]|nr:hypothetical protein [Bacteroidales bacterium]